MPEEMLVGVAIAAVASMLACRALIAAGLWDEPDIARKAHRTRTPTSGGVGIAFGFALGLMALVFTETLHGADVEAHVLARLAAAAGFACLFMLVGFFDDVRPWGPRAKFALFALLSLSAAYIVGLVRAPLLDEFSPALGLAFSLIGSALFVFTMVNSVNFMDGANGLAMGSVAVGLAALAAIAFAHGALGPGSLALCGAGALLGFLLWNFPDGKLFAGDSGALFAGALAALVSLGAIREGGVSPFIPPILFFPLLADVLLTLAWRLKRRRDLLDGHSEHLYQIALRAGFSHARAALVYWAAMAVCGVIALFAAQAGGWAPAAALASLALVSLVLSAIVRKHAVARGIAEI